MKQVNIHEAKTQLSKLVDEAVGGEPFVIAKAGRPLVRVSRIETPAPRLIGFMAGAFEVPDDFDEIGAEEIARAFAGEEDDDPDSGAG